MKLDFIKAYVVNISVTPVQLFVYNIDFYLHSYHIHTLQGATLVLTLFFFR